MAQSTKDSPVIQLRTLTKTYGVGDARHNALDSVNLKVEKGEFIAIMGPSGCGKTTLLNVLGLLDSCTSGEYLLDGKNVEQLSARAQAKVRSSQIGIVFQSFNLINRLTVLENVALPLTYSGQRRTNRLSAASESLKNFHLQEREYYMPWQLSGGQMQRVAIARALVNKPSIILADEPTGNLDSRASHVIMQELAELHTQGNTIIMVTHNPSLTSYATRVITMLDGKIATDTKIRVIIEDEGPIKIPLNFHTNATIATPADALPAVESKKRKKPRASRKKSPATRGALAPSRPSRAKKGGKQ